MLYKCNVCVRMKSVGNEEHVATELAPQTGSEDSVSAVSARGHQPPVHYSLFACAVLLLNQANNNGVVLRRQSWTVY